MSQFVMINQVARHSPRMGRPVLRDGGRSSPRNVTDISISRPNSVDRNDFDVMQRFQFSTSNSVSYLAYRDSVKNSIKDATRPMKVPTAAKEDYPSPVLEAIQVHSTRQLVTISPPTSPFHHATTNNEEKSGVIDIDEYMNLNDGCNEEDDASLSLSTVVPHSPQMGSFDDMLSTMSPSARLSPTPWRRNTMMPHVDGNNNPVFSFYNPYKIQRR